MNTYDRRRTNLNRLIDAWFEGKQVAFCESLDRPQAQVSAWQTQRRNMGEKVTRQLEEALGLAPGWFDHSKEDQDAVARNVGAALEWLSRIGPPHKIASLIGADASRIEAARETGVLDEDLQGKLEHIARLPLGSLALRELPPESFGTSGARNTTDPNHPLNRTPQPREGNPKRSAPLPDAADDLPQAGAASPNSPMALTAGPVLTRWVPVISWNQAAMWSETTDMNAPGYAEERLPFVQEDEKSFALRVQGDAMTAPSGLTYPEGCLIVVDPMRRQPANGERVVARLADGSLVFRVFMEEAGQRWLRALNQGYPPMTDAFEVLGAVTWTFRKE